MNALAEADRERLARLLGMLGSAFDGEVANAGRLADKLVRGAGLTWPDIIAPALPSPDHRGDTAADPLRDWRAMAAAARASRTCSIGGSGNSSVTYSDFRD